MTNPDRLVSFVLPCWNAERFLPEALASILAQTHAELEVVALDDGSSDGTRAILEAAAARDGRVRVVARDENRGLIHTLNEGVARARGPWLARMDADDVAEPERIARQLELFTRRPDTGVVGTGVRFVDEAGAPLRRLRPRCTSPEGARFLSLFATPVVHPSILARTEVMRRHPYREEAEVAHTEDYELFARMARSGVRIRNLEEPLLRLRMSPGSVSRTNEELQVRNFVRCARAALREATGLVPDPGVHRVLVNRMDPEVTVADLVGGLRLLDRLVERYLREVGVEGTIREEVLAVADEQRLDIVLQAFLRGPLPRRAAAPVLAARYAARLLSRPSLRHLAAKLGRGDGEPR